jgi:Asp-tRNA(Asn)/Glu-tRNA(Gln) amidotransferase A subunit family amidase
MVSFATGTQTMGSTIRPCGYCGVTGYKPTYNLVPKRGVWPNADSCDTIGLVARNVRDVAFFGAEMARYPDLLIPDESIAMDQRPTVGLCKTFEWDLADQHIQNAFHESARMLEKAGAKVVEIQLPQLFSQMLQAHTTVVHFEMSGGFMDILNRHAEKMRPTLLKRSLEGLSVTGREYQAAQALAQQCRASFDQVLGPCDVLFVPAATGEAPLGQDYSGDTRMNQVWTLMHGPCVSVTGGYGPNGLPLAMQVVGRVNDDQRTLLAAHWIHTQLFRALGA